MDSSTLAASAWPTIPRSGRRQLTQAPTGFRPTTPEHVVKFPEHLRNDEKKGHHAAVRSLAFKWIRIIFRCWQDRKPYDEEIYLQSLRRRGSPLGSALGSATQFGYTTDE